MPVKLSIDESVSEAAVEHDNRSTAKVESTGVKPTYTCPIHPEIQQDHPGSCPKCGIAMGTGAAIGLSSLSVIGNALRLRKVRL
jgi:uncharacterized FAD-dependent dehydrogenase